MRNYIKRVAALGKPRTQELGLGLGDMRLLYHLSRQHFLCFKETEMMVFQFIVLYNLVVITPTLYSSLACVRLHENH